MAGRSPDYAPYPVVSPDAAAPAPPPSYDSVMRSPDYAAYPTLSREDVTPPAPPVISPSAPPLSANPYVSASQASGPGGKVTREGVRDMLGKFGKRFGEAAKKTEGLAGDVWQHLKTGPSITDAAMGRIAQTTKVVAEGGYEKIFQQTFEPVTGEKFKKAFPCYLSTSAGPIMGVLYVSTARLAFCSDNPVKSQTPGESEARLYKVAIPVRQIRSANPSTSQQKPGEKYIQVASVDGHEFWFMAFVNYDGALKSLQETVSDVAASGAGA